MKFLEAYEKGIEIAKSKEKPTYKDSFVEMYHNGFLFAFVDERGDLQFISRLVSGFEFMESNQWEVQYAN